MSDEVQRSQLSDEECWDLLRREEFGRLGYILDGRANIVPINYRVDGRSLVFRTAEGSKVHAIMIDHDVAFEVDRVEDETATSIVLRGIAQPIDHPHEGYFEQLGLRAWLANRKPILIRITPTEIHGRHFLLSRPWKHMRR